MNTENNHDLVTEGLQRISDAARFLGVSRSLIYRLINSGVLPWCESVAAGEFRFGLSMNWRRRTGVCVVSPS